MAARRFTRNIEDFTCENCGERVRGTGYTDHCPRCLVSKHVDINPGDRKSKCRALMMPIWVEYKKQQFTIIYKCTGCGAIKKVNAAPGDNTEILHSLVKA